MANARPIILWGESSSPPYWYISVPRRVRLPDGRVATQRRIQQVRAYIHGVDDDTVGAVEAPLSTAEVAGRVVAIAKARSRTPEKASSELRAYLDAHATDDQVVVLLNAAARSKQVIRTLKTTGTAVGGILGTAMGVVISLATQTPAKGAAVMTVGMAALCSGLGYLTSSELTALLNKLDTKAAAGVAISHYLPEWSKRSA